MLACNHERFLIQAMATSVTMGKTGSVVWQKIKGRKGQVRMVPSSEVSYKKPGPLHKYTSSGSRRRWMKRSEKAASTR
jgi:hypothetical protein